MSCDFLRILCKYCMLHLYIKKNYDSKGGRKREKNFLCVKWNIEFLHNILRKSHDIFNNKRWCIV